MNEKLLEKKLNEGVKKRGGASLKLASMSFTGMPDRTVLMPGGRVFFAEVKTTGKKPTPRQTVVIELLRKLGFEVWIVDDETTLQEFFNRIDK